ncbi:MAG TPA: beta-ketoacyl-[acyl-carrier-protein] synthase family protein [Holophagaceae bacterium]|nr:beta-ketoacyl-[acyl-carrier-protein] synthase family protein [Holophagaceae bacterium]
MTPRPPAHLGALGLACALGRGKAQVAAALLRGDTSGLALEEGWLPGRPARVGRVRGELAPPPPAFADDDSRNTRLALAALEEIRDEVDRAVQKHGRARVGVVLGTSTSGIEATERAVAHQRVHGAFPAWFHYRQQEIGRLAPFIAEFLGLRGPALTISTACTSSGKAMVSAAELIRLGLCDAVITGGSDSLCRLTLNGFSSLESATPELCNPMSRNRRGINIGEGAALFLLQKAPSELALLGSGASSDAHHISSPDPSGAGAERAMAEALADAGLRADQVGYVNLHATATAKNDEMESRAMAALFPEGVPCSGTKPLTGHALGASAALELAFCWLTLQEAWNPQRLLPPHRWDGEGDPELPALRLARPGDRLGKSELCMSNSFAFGGNNLSLLLGPTP